MCSPKLQQIFTNLFFFHSVYFFILLAVATAIATAAIVEQQEQSEWDEYSIFTKFEKFISKFGHKAIDFIKVGHSCYIVLNDPQCIVMQKIGNFEVVHRLNYWTDLAQIFF